MNRVGITRLVLSILTMGSLMVGQTLAAVPPSQGRPTDGIARPPRGMPGRGDPVRPQFSSETLAVMQDLREVSAKVDKARQALAGDKKIDTLQKTVVDARAAYDKKLNEKLDASSGTAQLRKDMEKLRAQLRDSNLSLKRRREISRENRELTMKLRELQGRAREHPEVVALSKKVTTTSQALEKEVLKRLNADPKTRALVEKHEELQKKLRALLNREVKSRPRPVGPMLQRPVPRNQN